MERHQDTADDPMLTDTMGTICWRTSMVDTAAMIRIITPTTPVAQKHPFVGDVPFRFASGFHIDEGALIIILISFIASGA